MNQLSFLPPPIERPSFNKRHTIKDKSSRDFVVQSRHAVANDVDEDDDYEVDPNPTGERYIPAKPHEWTSVDDHHVRMFWGRYRIADIARSIPCSDEDLMLHAASIGLVYVPCTCPACTTVSMFDLVQKPCTRKAA
jgi:hypothetical protein